MKLEDEKIVAMCKDTAQVEIGIRHLIHKYKEKLYWQIKRIVEHHDDTEEVLQNVWIKIWQNIGGFKGESALSTWIYRITYNESISYVQGRKKQKLADWETSEPLIEAHTDEALFNHEIYDKDEVLKKIEVAIEKLPQKQKLIFHYRYNEEMPYSQIAEITGTSEGALKASFHHAVKKIEGFIKND
jgi:RNA polymerase sigma-70 factor (ECF subfamily)